MRWVHASELHGSSDASMASASVGRDYQSTMGLHERDDARSCSRKPLSKGGGRCFKSFCRLDVVQFHDLAKDISQTVITIQTLQHCQSASDLHFLPLLPLPCLSFTLHR